MIGELIDGRFRIIRRLAKGGMADVFLSKDPTRKCHVAIKLLRSRGPESQRRFVVEAEILSNLQHPGIVRAIAFGKTQDGQPYMALEYLAGEPLSQRLAHGALPWRDVAAIGIQVAGALHALHVAGIVHRDVKPANIMLTMEADRSHAKLIDLGLASVGTPFLEAQDAHFTPDPPARHQTQLGHPIGTPAYLPPEAGQCPAEPRLDVYSLGVTLYQLCTQLLPYTTGARPIREVCPGSDAPDDLWRLIQAALAADPAERLPSADHLRRGLEAILAAHPRTARSQHLFGGSYDRLEVLGVGASAVVFRASDRWLSREVAVKVLRDAAPSEDDAIRFRRAAKILSALRHENIPRILHFGIHDEQTFAVTELCPGSPATNFVRPDNHLRPDEVIAVGLQLAGALAAVHAAGVVYRDLHPGNVLIARGQSPRASIFDFDQAQVSQNFYAGLTERWATPPEERAEPKREKPLQNMDYASPEVRAGAAFSAASDVYALGLLLYRLLTGKRPFPATGGEPTPPRKLCPACPRGLEGLLLGMLSPVPHTRPGLAMVAMTLDDIQAELAEERAEADLAADAGPVEDDDQSKQAMGAPQAIAGATTATIITATDVDSPATATAPTAASSAGGLIARRTGRARGILVLMLTAIGSLAIGRATVVHDHDAADSDAKISTAASTREAAHERAERPGLSGGRLDMPSPGIAEDGATEAGLAVPAKEAAAMLDNPWPGIAENDAPPVEVVAWPPTKPPVEIGAPVESEPKRALAGVLGARPVRREPVTPAEAMAAARRAVAELRDCEGIPATLTADLDIVRGRGVVTTLNLHPLAPNDPRYPWHACVQQSLERVRFPVSDKTGQVRLRLMLRE